MSAVYLYAVVEESGAPRYIGVSQSPERRFKGHRPWVKHNAELVVLARFEDRDTARWCERWASKFLRSAGYELRNNEGGRRNESAFKEMAWHLRVRRGWSQDRIKELTGGVTG